MKKKMGDQIEITFTDVLGAIIAIYLILLYIKYMSS
jgi:hypothetical protein